MDLSPSDTQPDDPSQLPPARRRRARRRLVAALSADERAEYLEEIARRAAPSFDFFLFSLLSGAIFAFGFLVDAPYLLVLGAILSPLMAPAVGVALGTVLGSPRHFGRGLGGLVIGGFLVLVIGAVAGFAARIWEALPFSQAQLHTQLAWPPFLVLAVGAILTAALLVRDEQRASVPSVALAYGLYAPLSAAGFGLGSGVAHLWPDGVILFAIHLAWATLIGAGTLAVLGFRPHSLFGYSLGGAIALIGVILAIAFGSAGAVVGGQFAIPTASLTPTISITPSITASLTPVPPTETQTPTLTPTETLTATRTPSLTPTPVQALIEVEGQLGAVLRSEPGFGGSIVSSLLNGSLVEILLEDSQEVGNQTWVRVIDLENNVEGWILESLLATPTQSATQVLPATDTSAATETLTPTP